MSLKSFVLLEWDDVGSQNAVHLVNNYTSQQTGDKQQVQLSLFVFKNKIPHRYYNF